jgi:hypothetical protein
VIEYLAEQGIFPSDYDILVADMALEEHRWRLLELLYKAEIKTSEKMIREHDLI